MLQDKKEKKKKKKTCKNVEIKSRTTKRMETLFNDKSLMILHVTQWKWKQIMMPQEIR